MPTGPEKTRAAAPYVERHRIMVELSGELQTFEQNIEARRKSLNNRIKFYNDDVKECEEIEAKEKEEQKK